MNILPLHTQGFEHLVTLIFFNFTTGLKLFTQNHDDLPERVDGLCYDYRKSD